MGYPITIAQYIDGEIETLLDPEYWNGVDDFLDNEVWVDSEGYPEIRGNRGDRFLAASGARRILASGSFLRSGKLAQ